MRLNNTAVAGALKITGDNTTVDTALASDNDTPGSGGTIFSRPVPGPKSGPPSHRSGRRRDRHGGRLSWTVRIHGWRR